MEKAKKGEIMKFDELQAKMQIGKNQKVKGKNQEGKIFEKYGFRNAEDIFTHFKKLNSGWILTATDEILEIGGRIFVKAVVKAEKDEESHQSQALAELATVPAFKGTKQMSEPQWTGAVSSYARKYALQGLFGIGEEDVDGLAEEIKNTKFEIDDLDAEEIRVYSAMLGIDKEKVEARIQQFESQKAVDKALKTLKAKNGENKK